MDELGNMLYDVKDKLSDQEFKQMYEKISEARSKVLQEDAAALANISPHLLVQLVWGEEILYQYFRKEHIDTEERLSNEQWEEFVACVQSGFAMECREMAEEMFENWIAEHDDE